MVSYEDFYSGTVAYETPYGKMELSAIQLLRWSHKAYDALNATAYVLRPDYKIKAFGLDEREHVVYAAAEHPKTAFTFAVTAPYYKTAPFVSGDSMDSESEGSNRRCCPLCVLEKLSPLSEYPDSWGKDGKRWALKWRKACLQRILRSRKASDADKAIAYKLMTELDEQPRLF